MALLIASHPRQLDDPAELITNTINESLDTFGSRARFSLQQFIEGGALTAVTEPGLTGRAQQQRGYNGYKQRDEVFYEQRTARRTPMRGRWLIGAHGSPRSCIAILTSQTLLNVAPQPSQDSKGMSSQPIECHSALVEQKAKTTDAGCVTAWLATPGG